MGDEDKSLKAKITIVSDTKGAEDSTKAVEKTTAAIEKQSAATKELTDREKELAAWRKSLPEPTVTDHSVPTAREPRPDTPRYAPWTGSGLATAAPSMQPEVVKEVAKETEKLAEASKKAFVNLRGMGTAVSELGRQLVGISSLGRSFSNIFAVAILAVVSLYIKAKEALRQWNEEMDRQTERLGRPDFLAAINARKEAILQGALAADRFKDRLANVVDEEGRQQHAIRESIDALHEYKSAFDEIANAQFGLDNDKLKLQLQQGLISQTQYYIKLGELEKKHEADKLEREESTHKQELSLLQDDLKRVKERGLSLPDTAEKLDSKAITDMGDLAANRAQAQTLRSQHPDFEGEIQKAFAEVQKRKNASNAYRDLFPVAQAQTQLDELVGKAHYLAELDSKVGGLQFSADRSRTLADRAENAVFTNKSTQQSLEDEIAQRTRKFEISDSSARQAAAIHAKDVDAKTMLEVGNLDIGGGYKGSAFETDAGLRSREATNQQAGRDPFAGITQSQREWQAVFEKYVAETISMNQKIKDELAKLGGSGNANNIGVRLTELISLVSQVEQALNGRPGGPTGLNAHAQ